jgi:magnesium transporter
MLREQTKTAFITYCYITDDAGRLTGLVVMREMLLGQPRTSCRHHDPRPIRAAAGHAARRRAEGSAGEAFSGLSGVDANGELTGLVRGETLFANRAIAISGQSGSMVGVDKEERFGTPVRRSLLLRHPWLQVNC